MNPGTRYFFFSAVVLFSFVLLVQAGAARADDSGYLYLSESPDYGPLVIHPVPASGDTVLNDPPGFNWLPEEGSKGFILEISRDRLFSESACLLEKARARGPLVQADLSADPVIVRGVESFLVAGLPINLHHPSFRLGAGEWYWRWRCVFAAGKVSPPSAARGFVVHARALEDIVPPVKKLLARIPDKHPRLFLRPENLDRFKRLKDTSPGHAKLWKRIRAAADTLLALPVMTEPPPFPDRQSAFRNKTHEKHLLWRKYYNQARKMGQVLDFLGFCYLVSGDRKWSDRATEWLMALTLWDPEGPSNMMYNDEVAMPILLNGARCYDWIYDTFTGEQRTAIRKMLVIRG
ncbi:MAG: DUF4962 domain-containing protein, partial [Gemmatimonadota bacterium]|nr:DUF4962 domain-containing protein [Gemmatimonadota bacterium]